MDRKLFDRYMERFTSEPDGYGCINWMGAIAGGYAVVTYRGKLYRVARELWVREHPGDAPLTRLDYICHKCNNKGCVNIKHLYKGNAWTNAVDRMWKGRPFGEYLGFKPY